MNEPNILDFAAIIIACVAVYIAITESRLSRKQVELAHTHNRLSVRPLFQLSWVFDEDGRTGALLENTGFGPAIITSAFFTLNDREFDLSLQSRREILRLTDISDMNWRHTGVRLGAHFRAQQKEWLIWQEPAIADKKTRTKIGDAFSQLKFHISYKSLYDEEFEYSRTFYRR